MSTKKKTTPKVTVTDQTVTDQPTEPTPPANETPAPATPPKRKLSGQDFAMFYLCKHNDATVDDLRKALNDAGMKLAESTLETWPPFMAKIFAKLDELGWKRPDAK